MSGIWQPRYNITPQIARWLMEIEAAKAAVELAPLPPAAEAELRLRVRIRATHYSTRIEGNRLTLEEAGQAIQQKNFEIRGRERDVERYGITGKHCCALKIGPRRGNRFRKI